MRNAEEKPEVRFSQYYAWLQFNTKRTGKEHQMDTWEHLALWVKCLALLDQMGFSTSIDPYYEKNFEILSQYHRYGKWRDLEVGVEISSRGMMFEFYQNVNFDNPNGGKHDFDKFEKMPYLTKKRFEYATSQLSALIASEVPEALYEVVDKCQNAEEALLRDYRESWHHHGVETLADVQGSMKDYDLKQNCWDRDKKQLTCGEVKYFRDYDGRLRRGVVYWSLNSQWYVILHPTSYTTRSASALFDPTPEDFAVRRLKKGRIPEARQQQLDLLNSLTPGQLQKQMARLAKAPKRVVA